MMNRCKKAYIFTICFCTLAGAAPYTFAQDAQQNDSNTSHITQTERLSLAKEFLKRMRSGFSAAEQMLQPVVGAVTPQQKGAQNVLPEGEDLIFQAGIEHNKKRFSLESIIYGRVENAKVLLSLKDFFSVLEFPIIVNPQEKTAQGWYIRENRIFSLDLDAGIARSALGEFEVSSAAYAEEADIFVSQADLETWFGFELRLDASSLFLRVVTPEKLPIQERIERNKKTAPRTSKVDPVLPLQDNPRRIVDVPFVDVSTRSSYYRPGGSGEDSDVNHTANIRTAGDFLYGTLSTQTQIDDEDKLSNIRVNYKQESVDRDLLGPLKAKRFELGDVVQTRLPIEGVVRQELGGRITNADRLRGFTNPTTGISGTAIPGWDVELYRENQFLGFQRVGSDGFYNFENVLLYGLENDFRVVFYGPQGEIREEQVSVPVDISRIASGQATYDVSLTLDNRQTYRKNDITDEDKGSPTLLALYEKPIAPGTVLSTGLRSQQNEGERDNVVYGGISTILNQALINANVAIDDEADYSTELVARRSFGDHDFVSTTRYYTDNYDTATNGGENTVGQFNTQLNVNGDLPIPLGAKPRYTGVLGYTNTNSGNTSKRAALGFNTRFKNFTFNESVEYRKDSAVPDATLENIASVSGAFGRNRFRLRTNYEMRPESKLKNVSATYNRYINNDLEFDLSLDRRIDPSLTEARAQLNWQAGWARISPSIRYNSDNDFFAGLNTNFGLARDPQDSGIRSFDQSITGNGGISVFVFLDENGDGQFNAGERPLENVDVRALQNGGREVTNENGVAFFDRVTELKRTDVFVEEESLEDPFWISGFEGVSVLPREGYVAELQFPIHVAGELDGTLYARSEYGEPQALRSVPIHLYNADGEVEQTANTDIGGFYLFSRVPPGRYLLLVDEQAAEAGNFARPKPQQIEIGYEGTIVYGNDVYVDAGQQDIPSTILASLEDYKSLHPHIDFAATDYNITLNLGEYNSRLLMSTVWYRLHTRYRKILSGGELMVLPQHSYADAKTGKHTLRVGFRHADLEDAYNRCRALIARNIECKVEVLPAMENKVAMGRSMPG